MHKKAKRLFWGLFLAAAVIMTVEIAGSDAEKSTKITYPAGAERKQLLLSDAEGVENLPAAEKQPTEENELSGENELLGESVPVGETDRQDGKDSLTEEKLQEKEEPVSLEEVEEQPAENVQVEEHPAETIVIEEETTPIAPSFEGNADRTAQEETEKMTVSALLECINAERSRAGVALLGYSEELAAAAGVRSVEAVSLFNHTRPDGTDFFTVSELAMAENLARGSLNTTAQEIVNKWMESTGGHRQNILDAGLYTIGIAIYEKDGQLSICALFG